MMYDERENPFEFSIHSIRNFSEPNLPKPSGLKGVQPAFKATYIPKRCTCQVFFQGEDVWIKHRDYFSPTLDLPEDLGTPLTYRAKKYLGKEVTARFVYPDCWGAIVLRCEAWLCFKGLLNCKNEFPPQLVQRMVRSIENYHNLAEFDLMSTSMERFLEEVVEGLSKFR